MEGSQDRGDLLACLLFRATPRSRELETQRDIMAAENRMWNVLLEERSSLEETFRRHLSRLFGRPVEVNVFMRRESLEIAALVLGAYAFVRDYKTIRDSATMLEEDLKRFLNARDRGGVWEVDTHVWTRAPNEEGSAGEEPADGGMAKGERYAFLYLMISNIVLIVLLGLLLVLPGIP